MWTIRELAVTAKPSKPELQAGQGEFRQGKPDQLQSWAVADSYQGLWPVTSESNTVVQGYTVTESPDVPVLWSGDVLPVSVKAEQK